MAEKTTSGPTSSVALPGISSRAPLRPRVVDDKLQAIDDLCRQIKEHIGLGLTLARDNPGKTPPSWSVTGRGNRKVLTFGLIDRTFFWTWDEGISNHYAKDAEMMTRIITSEMQRFGFLV